MRLKKRVIPMLAGALAAIMLTSTASAHPYDYWSGKYIGKDNAEILLRIDTNAQTSLLTWGDVYQYGYDWNNISSNVKVSLALAGSGTPSLYEEVGVRGESAKNGLLAITVPYDLNGNVMIENGYYDNSSDWASSRITMNTYPTIFGTGATAAAAARKTFVHEVGHALKLSHPFPSNGLGGHTIDGRPKAIMNQGYPGDYGGASTATITDHDKSCLKAKWGA